MSLESLKPISAEDLGVKREEAILPNGLKVVCFERPNQPVFVEVLALAGSRNDEEGLDGTAHFNEHMLVMGSENYPSKDLLSAHIESYGGSLGASTGREELSTRTSVGDPNDANIAFEILHEMLLSSKNDPVAIESERGAIHTEQDRKHSNPQDWTPRIFSKLVYQDTNIGRHVLGNEETLNRIGREDIIRFNKKMFNTGRMVLVASGGISIEKITKYANEYLPIAEGRRPEKSPPLPVKRNDEVVIEHFNNTKQVYIAFGFRTAPLYSDDQAALEIISQALGGGRASILTKILRYEKGLVYGVSASSSHISDAGVFSINTSTQKEHLQELIDTIQDEIKKIQDNGVASDDIKFVQNKIVKSLREDLQTSKSWVYKHSSHELLSESAYGLQEYTQGLINVTAEDTKRVAQKYFGANKWYLAMCGDIATKDIKIDL